MCSRGKKKKKSTEEKGKKDHDYEGEIMRIMVNDRERRSANKEEEEGTNIYKKKRKYQINSCYRDIE